jgi:hypothetical protein
LIDPPRKSSTVVSSTFTPDQIRTAAKFERAGGADLVWKSAASFLVAKVTQDDVDTVVKFDATGQATFDTWSGKSTLGFLLRFFTLSRASTGYFPQCTL